MTKQHRILLVDDDRFLLSPFVDALIMEGYSVATAGDVQTAKTMIAENPPDLAILDLMLPLGGGEEDQFEARGGFASGIVLAKWIKANHPDVRFVGFSAINNLEVGDFFKEYGCGFFCKGSITTQYMVRVVANALDKPNPAMELRSFIVHGHDDTAKLELKNYVQNVLKLPQPVVLHEQPSFGRTILEKFEEAADDVDLVFVLLTPDDRGAAVADNNKTKRRARQNVVFELGYLFGALRRRSGRVLLLHKGPLELPSDISGMVYIDISSGIEAAGEEIRRELAGIL